MIGGFGQPGNFQDEGHRLDKIGALERAGEGIFL
jgi:hypothetical protein